MFIAILYIAAIMIALSSFDARPKTLESAIIAGALFISASILHAKERDKHNKE